MQLECIKFPGWYAFEVHQRSEVPAAVCRHHDDRHAIDEGEGYGDAAEFRLAHERFWNCYIDDLRARLADPTFRIDDDTRVVLQRFKVVERLNADGEID